MRKVNFSRAAADARRDRLLRAALLLLARGGCGNGGSAPHDRSGDALAPAVAPLPALPPTAKVSPQPDEAELATLASAMIIPVAGAKMSDLVDTFHEARGKRQHAAVDILAPRGTHVLSAIDGRVLQISQSVNGGLMIFAVDPSERFTLLYAHLERYADGLTTGMRLRRGQVIGEVGTSGNAPPGTPHLHFAIAFSPGSQRWSHGTPIDPLPLLRTRVAQR